MVLEQTTEDDTTALSDTGDSVTTTTTATKKTKIDFFRETTWSRATFTRVFKHLKNELENYLAEPPIPRKENPLMWWEG